MQACRDILLRFGEKGMNLIASSDAAIKIEVDGVEAKTSQNGSTIRSARAL